MIVSLALLPRNLVQCDACYIAQNTVKRIWMNFLNVIGDSQVNWEYCMDGCVSCCHVPTRKECAESTKAEWLCIFWHKLVCAAQCVWPCWLTRFRRRNGNHATGNRYTIRGKLFTHVTLLLSPSCKRRLASYCRVCHCSDLTTWRPGPAQASEKLLNG